MLEYTLKTPSVPHTEEITEAEGDLQCPGQRHESLPGLPSTVTEKHQPYRPGETQHYVFMWGALQGTAQTEWSLL